MTTSTSAKAAASSTTPQQQQEKRQQASQGLSASPRSSPTPHSSPQIRHAGRAHVRGKIRRVWRPRYLELWDNGLVRYHELPAASNADGVIGNDIVALPSELHHANDSDQLKIPKYTLQIYHARILDVTTFRDMHVGLPRGAFGFVFRGQRLLHLEHEEEDDGEGEYYNNVHSDDLLQSSSSTPRQRSLSLTTMNSSPSPTPHSAASMVGACQQGEPVVKEARDFLCAVSSLEEAQMWVVALQWAAANTTTSDGFSMIPSPDHSRRPSLSIPTTAAKVAITTTSSSPTSAEMDEWEDATVGTVGSGDHHGVTTSLSSFETIPPPRTLGSQGRFLSAPNKFSNEPTAPVQPFRRHNRRAASRGKVVVTKVTRLVPVRLSNRTWEMAYQVHGLMLQQQQQRHSQSQSQHHHQQQQVVQQWTMLRTAMDLEQLVANLCKELGPALLDRVQLGALRNLPRLQQPRRPPSSGGGKTHQQKSSSTTTTLLPSFHLSSFYSHDEWIRSVTIVDGILRSMVSDASMVNATAMKVFLGLATSTTMTTMRHQNTSTASSNSNSTTAPLWPWLSSLFCGPYHDGKAVLTRTVQPLPESSTPDQYVKVWLLEHRSQPQSSSSSSSRSNSSSSPRGSSSRCRKSAASTSNAIMTTRDFYAATLLQRPNSILWLGGLSLCAGCVVILPLCKAFFFGQTSSSIRSSSSSSSWWSMPYLSIRLDCLVASWMGAAYIGRHGLPSFLRASSSSKSKSPSRKMLSSSSKSSKRHTTSSTSSSSSRKPVDSENTTSKTGTEVVAGVHVSTTTSTTLPIPRREEEDATSVAPEDDDEESEGYEGDSFDDENAYRLSSPLPEYSDNEGFSCWSKPPCNIFHVRSASYLQDRVKEPSGQQALTCRGVDVWMTDNPERHIARHPAVLGGKLKENPNGHDTFLVNFLLPFGNFVTYFTIPPLQEFPEKLRSVWTKFLNGDQQYRDARLKLLPVVVEGPWIVKAAVGPGKSPALLGKVIPLQYFFRKGDPKKKEGGVYEVDVIITASTIAKGILSVVKSHTKALTIAFAFIIEAAEEEELPETVLCSVQVHSLHLEDCPMLPPFDNHDDNEIRD